MEKSTRFSFGEYIGQSSEVQNSAMLTLKKLDGPSGVGQCQILLKDIVAFWICPLDPGDYGSHTVWEVPGKSKCGLVYQCQSKRSDTPGCHCPALPATSASESLGEERDGDSGVHAGHMEVRQVAAVAANDGHTPIKDFFNVKDPDLIRLEAFILLRSLWYLFCLTQLFIPNTPLPGSSLSLGPCCDVLPATVPHALLRIFSQGCLDSRDGGVSLEYLPLSTPWLWRQISALI